MKRSTDVPVDAIYLRKTQLIAAMEVLACELDTLGMQCAAVVLDPQIQSDDTRLFYAGNMSRKSGECLMRSYLEIAENPKVEVRAIRTSLAVN
jgi:hypothetical protein